MGERIVGVTDTASGAGVADIRTRERSVGGNTAAEQYVIPIDEKVPSYRGMVSSFRAIGSAATPQWHFYMKNATASSVLVAVRSVIVTMDSTAANTAANGVFGLSRATGTAAGGTAPTKVSMGTGADASESSDANVTFLFGASADGTNSLITGLTAGSWMSRRFGNRLHTAVGQALGPSVELIPPALARYGVILRDQDEQLGVNSVWVAGADNQATNFYLTSVMWEEYTLP